jgi:peptide deformylase
MVYSIHVNYKRLKVIHDPHPVLRKRAELVSLPLSSEDELLGLSLLHYVHQSQDPAYAEKKKIREGIGLAAPQVGVSKRMTAISYTIEEKKTEYILVNPVIVSSSIKKIALKQGEGCLSVDEAYEGYVYRAFKIKVKAYDLLQKQDIVIETSGFDAIVLQHEIDHLNGILFYDYIKKDNPFFEQTNAELL